MRKNEGLTLIELLVIMAIIAILASVLSGGCRGRGDGDRVGMVVSLEFNGIFWKTWEGELILGGQGAVTGGTWNFSVTDPEVCEQLKEARDSQKLVRLTYHQTAVMHPSRGSTTYFITKVTPVNPKEE